MEKSTFVHRLNPLTKMALFLVTIIISFIFYNPVLCFGITLVMVLLIIVARTLKGFLNTLVIVIPIITALMVFQIFAPALPKVEKEFTLQISGLMLKGYQEGLYHGLVLSGRILAIVAAGGLLITTSHPADIMTSLRRLKFPYIAGFIIITSLQYIPILQKEFITIVEAQQSRGFKTRGFKALIPTLIPLFLISLQRVKQLALTLESRGFGSSGKKTFLREVRFRTQDYAIIGASFCLLGLSIWYRISYGTLSQIEEMSLSTATLHAFTFGALIAFITSLLYLFLRYLK